MLLQSLGNRFNVRGDFNANNFYWGSRLNTTKGIELLSAKKETNCNIQSTGKPTYWPIDPQKIPDLIDFFITKNISVNTSIKESDHFSSDHSFIILRVDENILNVTQTVTLANKETDWDSFKQDLESFINLSVPLKTLDC